MTPKDKLEELKAMLRDWSLTETRGSGADGIGYTCGKNNYVIATNLKLMIEKIAEILDESYGKGEQLK